MALIHFIVSPLRRSIGLSWPWEEKKIEKITPLFKSHICRGPEHAEILTQKAITAGAQLIVCVGSDSTLNEIVNGLATTPFPPPLAFYPTLQKGDFVKNFSLTESIEALLTGFFKKTLINQKVDIGEVEFTGEYDQKIKRRFINSFGFGFTSKVVKKLNQNHQGKRSQFNFLRLIVRLIPFYRHPTVRLLINKTQIIEKQEILTGLIHNGRYAMNGIDFSPLSLISDQKCELTLISKTYRHKYLLALFPLFAGKLTTMNFVRQFPFREIEIHPVPSSKKIPIDFDGISSGFLPSKITILPQALTVVHA